MPKVKALGTQQREKQSATTSLKANIAYYAKLYEYRYREIAELIGLSGTSFYGRMYDPATFKLGELVKIAQVFKIPVSRLLKKNEEGGESNL